MIRAFLLLTFVFVAFGCTSTSIKPNNSLTFQNVEDFKPGKTTAAEIEAKLGAPNEIKTENNRQIWTYVDSATGYQRLTLKFKESQILESNLWVPFDSEPESEINYIKKRFSNSEFLPLKSESTNPHISTTPISYRDLKMGISFMVEFGKRVEAIAFFEPVSSREITSQENVSPTQFKIGN